MKKCFVLLLGLLLGSVFVVGEPSTGVFGVDDKSGIDSDAAALGENIDKFSPLDDSGKIDYGKYKPYVTNASKRIDEINLRLDENVGWMRYIFHMKPAVSWLFFIMVYVILWFFVVLFLNGKELWFFIEKKRGRMIFGGAIFFILMVVKLYYGLANVIYNWLVYLFTAIAEAAFWMGLFFIVLCIVGFFFGFAVIGAVFAWWARYNAAKEQIRIATEMETSTEAMNALINEVGRKG